MDLQRDWETPSCEPTSRTFIGATTATIFPSSSWTKEPNAVRYVRDILVPSTC